MKRIQYNYLYFQNEKLRKDKKALENENKDLLKRLDEMNKRYYRYKADARKFFTIQSILYITCIIIAIIITMEVRV